MTPKLLNYRREILLTLAVLVVSLLCVFVCGFALFRMMDRDPHSYKLSGVLIGPSIACLIITSAVAFGIARLWRYSSLVLGLIAAIPYVAMSGLLLLELRFEGVAFWAGAGLITSAIYVAAIKLQRSK